MVEGKLSNMFLIFVTFGYLSTNEKKHYHKNIFFVKLKYTESAFRKTQANLLIEHKLWNKICEI